MGLPYSHRVSRVLCYSGTPRSFNVFRLQDYYFILWGFPAYFDYKLKLTQCGSETPFKKYKWFGLIPFRSPLLRKSLIYFLFLQVLRCFSSLGSPLAHYVFMCRYLKITSSEFPHSEIFGSQFICNSPKLIAACHVFHRRLVPRHPPYALSSLIKLITRFDSYTRIACLLYSKLPLAFYFVNFTQRNCI